MSAGADAFHETLTVIDGCQFSNWFQCGFADTQVYNVNREYFEHWRAGGVSAVQVTVSTWESARPTLDTLSRWYRVFRDHSDLVVPATRGADIVAAKTAGRTAVILGMQNTSAFEDDLGLVEVFHRLGIRFAQATYNLQNFVGASCYDPVDGGLTRYGRFVLGEMNRLGMIMDTSHVGDRTTLDCIEHSGRPVVATHANPRLFFGHKRNKTEEVMRALARSGGILGLATYPALCPRGTTLESWCEMVAQSRRCHGGRARRAGQRLRDGLDHRGRNDHQHVALEPRARLRRPYQSAPRLGPDARMVAVVGGLSQYHRGPARPGLLGSGDGRDHGRELAAHLYRGFRACALSAGCRRDRADPVQL